jgi:microcystin degradation protein MlrC
MARPRGLSLVTQRQEYKGTFVRYNPQMPTVLIAECKQEISSFNPLPSRYEDFTVLFGEEILNCHRKLGSEIGGALRVFDSHPDLKLVPTCSAAMITCGGILAAADFARIESEFLGALKREPHADGAFFAMHGAMVAEDEDDVEGHLLAEARKILGEQIPIVVSLDLHGILTDRMLEHADAVVSYQTYPHVDFVSTGERSARLLLRLMTREVKPVTAKVEVPALVRGDELITEKGLIRHVVRAAQAAEAAFEAGVGRTVRTNVGGALDPSRFHPMTIEGRVHLLSEGLFRSEKTHDLWNSGRTAVVQANGYTLIFISRPVHLYDRSLFYAHGQDPQSFDVVVVKSPQCEPHMFREWAARYVDVDAPGATSANLRSLGHRRCPRPMFPLDDGVSFSPKAKIFRRRTT